MILYHFICEEFGLKDIRERRLKVSDIANLNDPFDFLSIAAPTKIERQQLRKWRTAMTKEQGLICFSRNWRSPVQWGHYADRHKGLCLGFEIDDRDVRQVNYVNSRPVWPSIPEPWPAEVKERMVDQLLYTKFAHWSYEDEYRLFTSKGSQESDGHFYLRFSDKMKLKSVLVGACSTLTRAALSDALADLESDVETIKVRLAFKDFRIVRQRKLSGWR